MRFNTSEQNKDLFPAGLYDFEVVGASESISTNGNDMLVLKIRIASAGVNKVITDHIVASNIKKLKRVSQACGLGDLFESGEIPAESFVGRVGKAKVIVEKSANQNYRDRNVVEAYLGRR